MSKSYLYDDIGLRKGFNDFGQGSYKVLPDHGCTFQRDTMREMGFTLFQDFCMEKDDATKVRWWFQNVKTWEARVSGIEKMGYKAIDKLQIT